MKKIRLPEMIDYFRKENGWTMKEFGEKLNKSESAISKWIKGDRSPMVEDFDKMVNLFNTDPDTLMYGASEASILSEINTVSSQLKEPRQKIVLDTAITQLKEQKEEEKKNTNVIPLKKKRLTDEELWEVVEHGVASDGSEQTEYEKQFFFNLLREKLDNDDSYED